MPSEVDSAKRGLVKLLRSLAEKPGVQLVLTRDSTNKQVQQAFRRAALKVHPDKGGEQAVFQELSATNDAWQDLLRKSESWFQKYENDRHPRVESSMFAPF